MAVITSYKVQGSIANLSVKLSIKEYSDLKGEVNNIHLIPESFINARSAFCS
jgi:hypothetical protein